MLTRASLAPDLEYGNTSTHKHDNRDYRKNLQHRSPPAVLAQFRLMFPSTEETRSDRHHLFRFVLVVFRILFPGSVSGTPQNRQPRIFRKVWVRLGQAALIKDGLAIRDDFAHEAAICAQPDSDRKVRTILLAHSLKHRTLGDCTCPPREPRRCFSFGILIKTCQCSRTSRLSPKE